MDGDDDLRRPRVLAGKGGAGVCWPSGTWTPFDLSEIAANGSRAARLTRSEVVEYKTDKGMRLQGALYYPAGYDPGRKYPTSVYLYERFADGVHRYVAPSSLASRSWNA